MPLQYQQLMLSDFSGGITDNYMEGLTNKYRVADNFLLNSLRRLFVRSGFRAMYDREDATKIQQMFDFDGSLLFLRNNYPYEFSTEVNLQPITMPTPANRAFTSIGSRYYFKGSQWRNQLYITSSARDRVIRFYRNGSNDLVGDTVGLPFINSSGITITPQSVGVANSYLYAFVWRYEYVVGGVTYRNYSPVYYSNEVTTNNPISTVAGNGVDIAGLPIISTAIDQYNVTDIKLEVYRTINGGTTYYLSKTVNHGVATVEDDTTDAILQTRSTLYTTGDLAELYPAPKSKYMIICNDIAWYANVEEEFADGSTEVKPFRIYQAEAGKPYGIIPDAFSDMDEDIVGLSQFQGFPLVFTKTFIYRIEGTANPDGTGAIRRRVISDYIGCLANNSIVETEGGIYFAAQSGIYYTDGYRFTSLITDELYNTWNEIVNSEIKKERIIGTYDKTNKRIYFSYSDSTNTENNRMIIYDLRFNSFTTFSGSNFFSSCLLYTNNLPSYYLATRCDGGGDANGVVAVDTLYHLRKDDYVKIGNKSGYIKTIDKTTREITLVTTMGGNIAVDLTAMPAVVNDDYVYISTPTFVEQLLRGDEQGYIWVHKEEFNSDVNRDTSKESPFFIEIPIDFEYVSSGLDFGNPAVRKWVQSLTQSFRGNTDLAVKIESINDDSNAGKPLKEFRSFGQISWGDPDEYWGNAENIWRPELIYNKQRHFPKNSLRCRYKQIRLRPSFTAILNSDNVEECDLIYTIPNDLSEFTVTLPTSEWPIRSVGYFIAFEDDNYNTNFPITNVNGNTLTVQGGGGVLEGNGKKWVIRGKLKNQRFEIKNLVFSFAMIDNIGNKYKNNESGEVSANN